MALPPDAHATPDAVPKQRLASVVSVLVAVALAGVAGKAAYTHFSEQAAERATESHNLQLDGLASDLQTEDMPYTDSVTASNRLLRDNTLAFGQPNIGPTKVTVNKDSPLPDLRFGNHSVANDFSVVDDVAKTMGGAATLFVKSGERFVRVATNIVTDAGARAVGTELDPKGAAIAMIRENKTFTGVTDILGKSYFAIYEPIHNATGETIGIWFVGHPVVSTSTVSTRLSE